MKILLTLLLVIPVYSQTVHYDKFKDVTTVAPSHHRTIARDSLVGYATYKGEKPDGNLNYFLVFTTGGREWQLLRDRELIILADAQRIILDRGTREGKVISVGVVEQIIYPIDREDLEKIANAESVEMKIGRVQAKLNDKDRQGMKDILAYK